MAEAEGQEAPQTTEQQAPETPAPQSQETPNAAGASQEATGEQGAGQGTGNEEADWQKQLDELYEKAGKDFWKHPKVAGRVGQLAERQATEKADRAIALANQQAEARRLDDLRKTNELAWAREKARIEDSASEAQAGWGEFLAINKARVDALPEELRAALGGKDYGRDLNRAKDSFLNDLTEAESDHKASTKLSKLLDKEREAAREAGRKEALAQNAKGERSPDLSGGSAPSADLTQEEFDKYRRDTSWLDANHERLNKAVAKGNIRY